MTGMVSKVLCGMVCVDLEDGCKCWFEPSVLRGIEVGDTISGNFWTFGIEQLLNVTKGSNITAFIQVLS